jgi:S-DNA-T family DNA segregation ATPase FtsK/SpoIIIE
VCIIDEAQNLFMHPQHGAQAAEDAAYVVRPGRAYGIIVVLAAQRPDKDSLPTAIRGIVTARFCLKVPDQDSNDMIPGHRVVQERLQRRGVPRQDRCGLGWLKADGEPQIVRTYKVDLPEAEKVAARARDMRDRAGPDPARAACRGSPGSAHPRHNRRGNRRTDQRVRQFLAAHHPPEEN